MALLVGFVVGVYSDTARAQSVGHSAMGAVQVIIKGPPYARWRFEEEAGMRRRDRPSKHTEANLTPKSYTIVFSEVADFITPKPVTVTVVANQVTPVLVEYLPGRPKALTAVYEPGTTYTRCFPTQVVLAVNYPVPDDYTGSDGAHFEKAFPLALTASGKIDASAAITGMREELKRLEAGFGCDVTQPTPSSSCRLSAESFARARRMYIDNPGIPEGFFWIPTGPFDQGWVKGEKHTLSVIADDKISSTGVVLEVVNELRSYDLASMDQDSWGDFSKIDVCGPDGFPQSKAGSYSILTLAGQGVTRSSTTPTKYISVDQQMLRYFFTPIYIKSIYEMVGQPNGWDMAAYLNEQKVCAPLTGEFVPWKINEPKDITNLINYSGQKPNSANCNLGMEFLPPGTTLYDIAAPMAVQQMNAIVEGLIAVPNSNIKPSLRPLSLETNPIKFFVKTSSIDGTPTPVPPTATFTHTPVPPTATFTHTPVPPTATFTHTPVPPTATFTHTPIPPTATFTPPPSCTAVSCAQGENLVCNRLDGCSNGCGYTCVATVPAPVSVSFDPFSPEYVNISAAVKEDGTATVSLDTGEILAGHYDPETRTLNATGATIGATINYGDTVSRGLFPQVIFLHPSGSNVSTGPESIDQKLYRFSDDGLLTGARETRKDGFYSLVTYQYRPVESVHKVVHREENTHNSRGEGIYWGQFWDYDGLGRKTQHLSLKNEMGGPQIVPFTAEYRVYDYNEKSLTTFSAQVHPSAISSPPTLGDANTIKNLAKHVFKGSLDAAPPILNPLIGTPVPFNYLTPIPLGATAPNLIVMPSLGSPRVGPDLGAPTLGPIQGVGRPFFNTSPPSFVGMVAPRPIGVISTPAFLSTPFPIMGPIQ